MCRSKNHSNTHTTVYTHKHTYTYNTHCLQVTEWKHRAADFFPFKSKTTTIDFWDFSGDHNYHIIYSSFRCCSSMHLLVFNSQEFDKSDILRWLAGIQATSRERIPVVLVFTHLDKFPSRDARESYKRRVVQWLHSWQQGVHRGHSQFFAPLPQSVKNIFGDDLASSLEAPPTKSSAAAATGEEVDSQQTDDLPLLPNIHRVYFVNAVSGDGVGPLRKCLVKIASGSLAPELTGFSGFRMIGREVPAVYGQVELLLRHLRGRFRSLRREGEQRPFYTISELVQKKLRRPLTEGGIMERDFVAALNFLHEVGSVYCRTSLIRTPMGQKKVSVFCEVSSLKCAVLGAGKGVLFGDVSSIQECPYRGVPHTHVHTMSCIMHEQSPCILHTVYALCVC